jgi:hypothetical protein
MAAWIENGRLSQVTARKVTPAASSSSTPRLSKVVPAERPGRCRGLRSARDFDADRQGCLNSSSRYAAAGLLVVSGWSPDGVDRRALLRCDHQSETLD